MSGVGETSAIADLSTRSRYQVDDILHTHNTTKSFVSTNAGKPMDEVFAEMDGRIKELEELVSKLIAEFMPEHNV